MSPLKRNNVKITGRGTRPMLFAHGFGCDQSMWRFLLPFFENDYRTITFDHVGVGGSDESAYDPSKYGSLEGYATDVNEIIKELGLKDVIFVGHSVSAMIGVLAAIAEPSAFARLVLIGPSPCYIDHPGYRGGFAKEQIEALLAKADADYFGWARAMAPAIMGNPDRPDLGQALTDSFCRANPGIARDFARVLFTSDNRSDLPRVRTPALILQCSQDIVAPEEVGRYVHEHIAGSTLEILRAAGHCPHVSAPEETAAAILKHLA